MERVRQSVCESESSAFGAAAFAPALRAMPAVRPSVEATGAEGTGMAPAFVWDVTGPNAQRRLKDILLANVSHPLVERTLRDMIAGDSDTLYDLAVDVLCELAGNDENLPLTRRFEDELIYILCADRGRLPAGHRPLGARPLGARPLGARTPGVRSRREEMIVLGLHRMRSRKVMPLWLELMPMAGPRLYDEAIDFDFDYDRREEIKAALSRYRDEMSRQGYPVSALAELAVSRARARLAERYANRQAGFEPVMIGPHSDLGRLYRRIVRATVGQGGLVGASAYLPVAALLQRIRSRFAWLPDADAQRAIRAAAGQILALRTLSEQPAEAADATTQLARDLLAMSLPLQVRNLAVPPGYAGPRLRFYRCDDPFMLLSTDAFARPTHDPASSAPARA